MRLYKAIIAFGLIILFPFLLLSRQKDIADNDGTDWISRINKVGFIEGFISGTSLMNEQAIQRKFSTYKKMKKDKPITKDKPIPIEDFQINMALDASGALSLYEITIGQLTDGVDTFYNDFSTRKIKVIDAIYVVKMQIRGSDPDLIAAQIRHLKLQPINMDELEVIWKKYWATFDETVPIYESGLITAEELLKIGYYVNKDKEFITLFCYGDY